jgi:phage tail sheath protein FI
MPNYQSPGVYVEEIVSGPSPIAGVGTAVAAFVGWTAQGEFNKPTLIHNWSQFINHFGGFPEPPLKDGELEQEEAKPAPSASSASGSQAEAKAEEKPEEKKPETRKELKPTQGASPRTSVSYLAHAVYGFFANGGSSCYVVRIGEKALTKEEERRAPRAAAALGEYRAVARIGGSKANDTTIEVTAPDTGTFPDDSFRIVVKQGDVTEDLGSVTTKRGDKTNFVTVVNEKSKLIRLESTRTRALERRPSAGTVERRPAAGTLALQGGADPFPAHLSSADYIGDPVSRSGLAGLEAEDLVTMVCVPDLVAAFQNGALNYDEFQTVQERVITHCENMGDRMAILDPPPGLNAQEVLKWRREEANFNSKYATLYWPHLTVMDPVTNTKVDVPPSGHMAGIWSRNDDTRGVHKAPANEVIRGVLEPAVKITKDEQTTLNPVGINCLRTFPGQGTLVWGARTLSGESSWRYLNVRRFFNYLEESILNGTQWCVFEPNDPALWARIRRTISAFLVNEWRRGALFGATPGEAFYVKCDDETNPQEGIEIGEVVCEIGVAPVKPAEFVIFRLSQMAGGTSLVAE